MADQGCGEHLGRVQRHAVEVVAAPALEVLVGIDRDVLACSAPQLLLEAALVDDHVHQRHRGDGVGRRGGRSHEDRVEGVGPALGGGAGQVADDGVGSDPLARLGPVGEELSPLVAVEDLAHHGTLHRPEGTVERPGAVDVGADQTGPPPLV